MPGPCLCCSPATTWEVGRAHPASKPFVLGLNASSFADRVKWSEYVLSRGAESWAVPRRWTVHYRLCTAFAFLKSVLYTHTGIAVTAAGGAIRPNYTWGTTCDDTASSLPSRRRRRYRLHSAGNHQDAGRSLSIHVFWCAYQAYETIQQQDGTSNHWSVVGLAGP